MKKMMIALTMMLLTAATGKAMSYEQARNEALFLTDKMAYELNLTDEQYEAAYEINLDYLMGVTSYDDVYGTYWERRNLDLSYILLDWQWNAFRAATYFYRPLYWRDGFWHFGIYARYPHRDYFYFGRPVFYASYRGGHAWHVVGGHGYYYGRRDYFRPVNGRSHFGMLDRWNRGDYRTHHSTMGNRSNYGNHHGYNGRDNRLGGNRTSSTRTTVNGQHENPRNNGNRPLGGYRSSQGSHATTSSSTSTTTHNRPSSASLGGSRSSNLGNGVSTRSNGSFSRGSSHSSGTFSGGSSHSSSVNSGSSAGRSSGGGHSYGGRR